MDKLLQLLHRYKHIQTRVELYWGSKDLRPYLSELLSPNRIGRKGFPLNDLQVIQELMELHDSEYPALAPKFDPWD
jgi:hypothetical protein